MRAARTLFVLVSITLLLDIVSFGLAEYGVSNIFLFHGYSWVEFFLVVIFYYRITPTKSWRVMLFALSASFVFISILSLILFQGFGEFNSLQRVVEAALIGAILVRYLTETFKRNDTTLRNPFFIQTAGFLLYFCGTLFLFSLGTEILNPDSDQIWMIHLVFNILLNISFTLTLWKARIR